MRILAALVAVVRGSYIQQVRGLLEANKMTISPGPDCTRIIFPHVGSRAWVLFVVMLLASPAFADVEVMLGYSQPGSSEYSPGAQQIVRAGGKYYGFASRDRHEQISLSQRMGNVHLYGAGLGLRGEVAPRIRLYAEAGIGLLGTAYNQRVVHEVAYYAFSPTFGEPPFLPDSGGWWSLEYTYEPDRTAPLFRVGTQYAVTNRFSIEVSYTYYMTSVYYSVWNPSINGGPVQGSFDACGCLWEGTGRLNLSSVGAGLVYRF